MSETNENAGFFEVMPQVTKVAFGLFILAKCLMLSAMMLMWVAHSASGALLVLAGLTLTLSVSCSIFQMFFKKNDSKKEFLRIEERYNALRKIHEADNRAST